MDIVGLIIAGIAYYIIFPILFISIFIFTRYIRYKNSAYKDASKNSFFKTITDKGNNGEFITFTYLEKLDFYKRLMTNLYLPKSDGTTTEIDLIMISHKGIYVFESKNYSGWIYGDERNKNWTQTLKSKEKNQFYNPIWQNKGHVNALMTVLDIHDDKVFKSIIVFSERCELKKINMSTSNVEVIKRNELTDTINKDQEDSLKVLSIDDIERIYLKLQEFTGVDHKIKESHIRNIRTRK